MEENRSDRPWGSFYVLVDQKNTKVKRLVVNPGHRLSYQSHKLRDEHWVVVQGEALVTLDDITKKYNYGEHLFIKRGTKHRLSCEGKVAVEIIEVQTGDDFPEEDIIRYSDDYQRAN